MLTVHSSHGAHKGIISKKQVPNVKQSPPMIRPTLSTPFSNHSASWSKALYFAGRKPLYQKPFVEEAMKLLSESSDPLSRNQFTLKLIQAFDAASPMSSGERVVYKRLGKLYGQFLGLKPQEVNCIEDIQIGFMKRALNAYAKAWQAAFKQHPKNFEKFAQAFQYRFSDEVFGYANKNGLGSSRSALGKMIQKIYWDDYSYSNGFFGYPSLHAAFLGCSPETLHASVIHQWVGDSVATNRLLPDYIHKTLIPGLPKAGVITDRETDILQNMKERQAFSLQIFKAIQPLYSELCKDISISQYEGEANALKFMLRESGSEKSKEAHLWQAVRNLTDLAIVPDGFYNIKSKQIISSLSEAALFNQLEKDFKQKRPSPSQKQVALPPSSILTKTALYSPKNLSFEQMLQYKGYQYPNPRDDRFSLLDHLFFVIGNGYEWEKGQLVSNGASRHEFVQYQGQQLTQNEFLKALQENRIESIPALKKGNATQKTKVYPISDDSRINHIPDDVKQDWLEAAIEALETAIQVDQEQRLTLEKILNSVKKRFKSRLK